MPALRLPARTLLAMGLLVICLVPTGCGSRPPAPSLEIPPELTEKSSGYSTPSTWTRSVPPPPEEQPVPGRLEPVESFVRRWQGLISHQNQPARWRLSFPSGDQFQWSVHPDTGQATFVLALNAEALLAAGLQPARLNPDNWRFQPAGPSLEGDPSPPLVVKTVAVGRGRDGPVSRKGDHLRPDTSAGDALRYILESHPDLLESSADGQWHSIRLPAGERFSWYANPGQSDADVKYTVPADQFLAAGVNPDRVDKLEWMYLSTGLSPVDLFLRSVRLGRGRNSDG